MNLYTLEVFIISGPMTEEFLKNNSVISRTIEIQGIHTLKDLHLAIFDAFDREDEHMYEFQIGGKGPNDPKADRYILQTHSEFQKMPPVKWRPSKYSHRFIRSEDRRHIRLLVRFWR